MNIHALGRDPPALAILLLLNDTCFQQELLQLAPLTFVKTPAANRQRIRTAWGYLIAREGGSMKQPKDVIAYRTTCFAFVSSTSKGPESTYQYRSIPFFVP